ncbi:hypothetical protein BUALT_Bualt07G0042100 [Buddleja alternifolia]|uniref:Calmodulin-binding protein 60 A-like n=1 Tax=Buddleja alternifolia TaxID=168488 RepID=A0AAV6X8Z1_9LAMI|nr:hypothetical protein BUALT_Bualt07G0042100 [Buddleja alternifolia]
MSREVLMLKMVEEELESAKMRILYRIKRMIKKRNQTSSWRSMTLEFRNKISQPILTGAVIKGEGNISVEVALIDGITGKVIDCGPEASARVEIVLLKGEFDASGGDDWTVEEFNENIVRETQGKKPFLEGNVHLKLQRGVIALDDIKFKHCTSKMKPPVFRLGARVVDTFYGAARVKEAKSESFTVKDYRKKYYKKHEIPSLSDKVSRLIYIRKGGPVDKRLESNKICTVEDFLIRLLIYPEGLKRIVNLGAKKWEAMVNNARACPDHKRMYCYINYDQHKTGVVFNILGQVLGLYSKNQYFTTTMLSENHKVDAQELLESAYKHWKDTVYFDDEDSLQQYLTGLQTYVDRLEPDYRGLTSNEHSNSSFGEIAVEDFGSFSTDDVEILYDDRLLQLSPHSAFIPENIFSDFDDFLNQNDNPKKQKVCSPHSV